MEICEQLEQKENQENHLGKRTSVRQEHSERAPLGEITHLFTKRPSKKIRVSQEISTTNLVKLR